MTAAEKKLQRDKAEVVKRIDRLFGNTGVSQEVTKSMIEDIRDHCRTLLESLEVYDE